MDGINSIEDIDTMLDAEFNIDENITDDNQSTETEPEGEGENVDNTATPEGETQSSDDGSDDSSNDEGTTDPNSNDDTSNTSDGGNSKKDYAFAKIRQENSDLKAKAKNAEANETFLKQLAANYGYNNVDDFVKALFMVQKTILSFKKLKIRVMTLCYIKNHKIISVESNNLKEN